VLAPFERSQVIDIHVDFCPAAAFATVGMAFA
jgi:hypothetical protein